MHAGPGVPDRTAAIGRPTAAVDGVDMAAGGRVEGADDDVVADGAEREPRDEGYPDAGGDEALHGEVVVDVEGDVGVKPAAAHAWARVSASGWPGLLVAIQASVTRSASLMTSRSASGWPGAG